MREQGIGALEEVEAVILEANGSFSVIPALHGRRASALKDVLGIRGDQRAA